MINISPLLSIAKSLVSLHQFLLFWYQMYYDLLQGKHAEKTFITSKQWWREGEPGFGGSGVNFFQKISTLSRTQSFHWAFSSCFQNIFTLTTKHTFFICWHTITLCVQPLPLQSRLLCKDHLICNIEELNNWIISLWYAFELL